MSITSGRSRQKARKPTRIGCVHTVLSLAVHPWQGETVRILRASIDGPVWIEREAEEGEGAADIRIVPRSWTALVPRTGPLQVDGQPVRLAPEALRELELFIVARSGGKKVARRIRSDQSDDREIPVESSGGPRSGHDGAHDDRAAAEGRDPFTATVVGEAGTADAASRSRGRSGRRSKQ